MHQLGLCLLFTAQRGCCYKADAAACGCMGLLPARPPAACGCRCQPGCGPGLASQPPLCTDAIRKAITSGFFYHTASLQKNGSYRTVKNPQARAARAGAALPHTRAAALGRRVPPAGSPLPQLPPRHLPPLCNRCRRCRRRRRRRCRRRRRPPPDPRPRLSLRADCARPPQQRPQRGHATLAGLSRAG